MADGYDPGVFVDDDGRVYLVSSAGKIVELSADGKTVINPSVSSYAGWNEGPELFKRAPYYYVTWSSNGTERGADGIVNSARSMSLAGSVGTGSDQSDPAEPEQRDRPRPSVRRAPALRGHSNAERRVVRHLPHLGMELRHAGPKHVPRARHLDGRRLVAPQERQEAEPHQRRTEPALHALRDPAQRRLLVDDARAAVVLPHHAGLVGAELVTLGPSGLPANQDPGRRRQRRCRLPGHASPAHRSEALRCGDGGLVRCPERRGSGGAHPALDGWPSTSCSR